MAAIFISYRRSDSADVSGRIYDRLVSVFHRNHVFKDVDNIPLGVPFQKHFIQVLEGARTALVIIGPSWASALDQDGRPRLFDPADYVRIEVEAAMRAGLEVVPIFVGGAGMPRREQLPESLWDLRGLNGIQVRPDPDFHGDMNRLIRHLESNSLTVPSEATPVQKPSPPAETARVQPSVRSAPNQNDSFFKNHGSEIALVVIGILGSSVRAWKLPNEAVENAIMICGIADLALVAWYLVRSVTQRPSGSLYPRIRKKLITIHWVLPALFIGAAFVSERFNLYWEVGFPLAVLAVLFRARGLWMYIAFRFY